MVEAFIVDTVRAFSWKARKRTAASWDWGTARSEIGVGRLEVLGATVINIMQFSIFYQPVDHVCLKVWVVPRLGLFFLFFYSLPAFSSPSLCQCSHVLLPLCLSIPFPFPSVAPRKSIPWGIVLISSSCQNKVPLTGWLWEEKCVSLQF